VTLAMLDVLVKVAPTPSVCYCAILLVVIWASSIIDVEMKIDI
jgi:hypothetical protein